MKKIGFIDYYIDEWHANNYPAWIRESSFGDRYDVALAWEESTQAGKKNIDQWCEEQQVTKASSVESLIEECDCLVVLSPDNPEKHEALADLPLQSGKPVYIDKPFAPTRAAAERLFEKADRHGTPLMSCSALRYGSALQKAVRETLAGQEATFVSTTGPGSFEVYAIHQIEMLVMTLGLGSKRVMQCGNAGANVLLIDYDDERRGAVQVCPGQPFRLFCRFGEGQALTVDKVDDIFQGLIEAMLGFFETRQSPVPSRETLEIASLCEAGNKALSKLDSWVTCP